MYEAIVGSTTRWLLSRQTNDVENEAAAATTSPTLTADEATKVTPPPQLPSSLPPTKRSSPSTKAMDAALNRLEKITCQLERMLVQNSTGAQPSQTLILNDFDAKVGAAFEQFVAINDQLSDSNVQLAKLKQVGKSVGEIVDFQRMFIGRYLIEHSKPASNDLLTPILAPLMNIISSLDELKASCVPKQDPFDHITAVSEASSLFGWFTLEPSAMVNYMIEMMRASEFYTNRILNSHKSSENDLHQIWISKWLALVRSFIDFVEQSFPEGRVWLGTSAIEQKPAVPPKPTHRKPPTTTTTPSNKSNQKEPSKRLEHNKIILEYFCDQQSLEVLVDEMKHSVYVFKCTNCTIQIKGKVNSVTIDSCNKLAAVIHSPVVSSLDCINSRSIQIQTMSVLPTISVDKTDGFQVYLSANHETCDLYSSMSTGVTISRPKKTGDQTDYEEYGVPNQIHTKCDAQGTITSTAKEGIF